MKSYTVKITDKAEKMMERYLAHLVYEKQNMQAAIAVSDDYDETVEELEAVAGSLRFCDDADLRNREIRKIKFRRHDYILLYKVQEDVAIVEAVYHTLQDYENLFKDEVDDYITNRSDV